MTENYCFYVQIYATVTLSTVAVCRARCYASAAYAIMRCPSVCLHVCHDCTFCQNK